MIYDLDGTLVDTLQDITHAANHMLAHMRVPPLTADRVRRYVGRGMQELVGECLNTDDPARVAEGMRIYRAFYHEHLAVHSRVYPQVVEALEYFSSRTQVVISNKPNPYSTDLLQALGIGRYFAEIVGGDSPYPRKPNPASVLAMMAKSGASAQETLFIGDSPIDIQTGKQAGVATVTVTHGLADRDDIMSAKPDFMVGGFEPLLRLAKARGW